MPQRKHWLNSTRACPGLERGSIKLICTSVHGMKGISWLLSQLTEILTNSRAPLSWQWITNTVENTRHWADHWVLEWMGGWMKGRQWTVFTVLGVTGSRLTLSPLTVCYFLAYLLNLHFLIWKIKWRLHGTRIKWNNLCKVRSTMSDTLQIFKNIINQPSYISKAT